MCLGHHSWCRNSTTIWYPIRNTFGGRSVDADMGRHGCQRTTNKSAFARRIS